VRPRRLALELLGVLRLHRSPHLPQLPAWPQGWLLALLLVLLPAHRLLQT